jgi:hypothetical protein
MEYSSMPYGRKWYVLSTPNYGEHICLDCSVLLRGVYDETRARLSPAVKCSPSIMLGVLLPASAGNF